MIAPEKPLRPVAAFGAALLLFALSAPTASRAQPAGAIGAGADRAGPRPDAPSPALAEARARFQRATELVKKQEYASAVVEFQAAYDLAPSYKILYDIGLAHERLKNFAPALRAFEQYLVHGGGRVPAGRRADVERAIAELRIRVGSVLVRVSGAGAEVAIDGVPVGRAPLGRPILVNAGPHEVTAREDGGERATKTIVVGGGETVSADLDLDVASRAPPSLDDVERALAGGDAEKARRGAEHILLEGLLVRSDFIRTYRLLACADALLDRPAAARDAFIALLASEPAYAEDRASALPAARSTADAGVDHRVQRALDEARAFWIAKGATPEVRGRVTFPATGLVTIGVETLDPTHVLARVNVGYRWGASGPFTITLLRPGEAVAVSPPSPSPGRLDYYAVALDAHGSEVLEDGSARAPKVVLQRVEPAAPHAEEARGSFFRSPLFWLGAVAVVVGGGTAAVYAASRSSSAPAQATFVPTLQCGKAACN